MRRGTDTAARATRTRLLRLGVGIALACAGCAHFPVNPPLERWEPHAANSVASERHGELLLIVAFSGGGTRAAAFGYGVLEELRDTLVEIGGERVRLVDEIDVVSAVSGGSFVAAYYGLHGDATFEEFGPRFLRRNVGMDLVLRLLNPINWVRMASPRFSRSDLAAEYYDAQIFDGATFAEMQKTFVVINASDMVRGSRFSFRQGEFDYLCSDLAKFPVARAVAASAALPGPFTPIVLMNHAGSCGFEEPAWIGETLAAREPSRRRLRQAQVLRSYLERRSPYVPLLDGGIVDNLGLRFTFERAIEEGGLAELLAASGREQTREIVLIVVNAETEGDIRERQGWIGAGITSLVGIISGIQIRSFNFETIELVSTSFRSWARALGRERGTPIGFHLVDLRFGDVRDPEERRFLGNLPTSLTLDDASIDRVRAAARELLKSSPAFAEVVRALQALPAREPPTPRAVGPPTAEAAPATGPLDDRHPAAPR
jgi:NTE family protein